MYALGVRESLELLLGGWREEVGFVEGLDGARPPKSSIAVSTAAFESSGSEPSSSSSKMAFRLAGGGREGIEEPDAFFVMFRP